MNEQPEALRLADALENCRDADERRKLSKPTATELRRLHEVNEELLEALKQIADPRLATQEPINIARAAIAKATKESK